MAVRTEELALSGLLPITVGGDPVELRVLTINQSQVWQQRVATALAAAQINLAALTTTSSLSELIGGLLVMATDGQLELLLAYDSACDTREGRLPAVDVLRDRMSTAELHAAIREVGRAEFPLGADLRLVAEAFGPHIRLGVAIGLERLLARTVTRLESEPSSNGPSPAGDSTQPTSGTGSPPSSS